MAQASPSFAGEPSGPIAYMANHPIVPNLLMFGIIVIGLMSLSGLDREAWPAVAFNMIEVSVVYPGATPEEIEEAIILKLEEKIESLDDVKTIRSQASPAVASVRIQFRSGTDLNNAMDEVKAAVEQIQSFPDGIERPQFREMDNRASVIRLILFGDTSERSLKNLAYEVKDKLKSLSAISLVEVTAARNDEISIEVPLSTLHALDLTLEDVAHAVRQGSLDLSAGTIETRDSEIRVRTVGKNYDQFDFEELIVLAQSDGTALRLRDIAIIRDEFEESNIRAQYRGMPAVFVEIFQVDGESVRDISESTNTHLQEVIIPSLPDGIGITVWNDDSPIYSDRADLLVRNGLLGLLLVFIALTLFLEIRLAFWVVMGLITSGVGALAVMQWFDLPLSTHSLFTFVLAIGIIVDDAIVVAEQIYSRRMSGLPGTAAAIRGARTVKTPLTFAVLTTVVVFTPILFIPGGLGDIWFVLPVVIIAMLKISLFESLFILPRHLSHLPGPEWKPSNLLDRLFFWSRTLVDQWLNKFLKGPLDRALQFATNYPVIILASVIGLFIICVSLTPTGLLPISATGGIEGDYIIAAIEMPDGTPSETTWEVVQEIESAGIRVFERFDKQRSEELPSLMAGVVSVMGQGPRLQGGGLNPTSTMNPPSNIAGIEFKLPASKYRDISTLDIVQAWREEVGPLPHVRGIAFSGELINLGNPVEVGLSHPSPDQLVIAADSVTEALTSILGVFDIQSDHSTGIGEIQLELQPVGRTLGLTVEDLAQQVRGAFFGVKAITLQREEEEVNVYARLPADERESITDIEQYLIQNQPTGKVPIGQVATMTMGQSSPVIRRKDGLRIITVTANVDDDVISGAQATELLENTSLTRLTDADPDLTYAFGGEQQEQLEAFNSLNRGFIIAMLGVFALLAIPLRSYRLPFILMIIIPFGWIGVTVGHLVLGVGLLTFVSFLGFFGLSGVIVNDALVMLDAIDRYISDGLSPRKAIIEGAKSRFRPIMLTSLTTFLTFTPLILETDVQAQFLIPFAASLGIGIMVGTGILMLLLPSLMAIFLQINSSRSLREEKTLI
ncbi:MAG: efflux RND transporter permease subunit [Bacteroidetes bacterium]|nr:efflux RND transporter permease subunit [Bacteroidota bacterium]